LSASGGHLDIERDKTLVDRTVSYTIFLDGEKCGEVANGARARFEVEAGGHTLRLTTQPWAQWRSPDMGFELTSGQVVRYRCRPSPNFWLVAYYLILDPRNWIRLEPIGLG
jgi:hypothetical protein